jgi:hypothetical protein
MSKDVERQVPIVLCVASGQVSKKDGFGQRAGNRSIGAVDYSRRSGDFSSKVIGCDARFDHNAKGSRVSGDGRRRISVGRGVRSSGSTTSGSKKIEGQQKGFERSYGSRTLRKKINELHERIRRGPIMFKVDFISSYSDLERAVSRYLHLLRDRANLQRRVVRVSEKLSNVDIMFDKFKKKSNVAVVPVVPDVRDRSDAASVSGTMSVASAATAVVTKKVDVVAIGRFPKPIKMVDASVQTVSVAALDVKKKPDPVVSQHVFKEQQSLLVTATQKLEVANKRYAAMRLQFTAVTTRESFLDREIRVLRQENAKLEKENKELLFSMQAFEHYD